MSNLIDRDKLIEQIRELEKIGADFYEGDLEKQQGFTHAIRTVIQCTEDQPTVNEWIPVLEAERSINSSEIKQGALFSNRPIEVHNKDDWDRFKADLDSTSSKMEQVGDCETCLHYEMGDGYCRDCGTTINHYEPYVPKENK